MKKKSRKVLTLLTHITLFSMFMSVACTHQQDRLIGENDLSSYNEEGTTDVAASEPSSSESTEAAAPSEDLTSFSNSDTSESVASDTTSESSPAVEETPAATSNEEAMSSDLSSLGGDIAATTPVTEPELLPSESDAQAASLSTDTLPMDPATSTDTLPTEAGQSEMASTDTLPTAEVPTDTTTLPDASTAATMDAVSAPAPDTTEVAVTEAPKVKEVTTVKSAAPEVPKGTVSRKGASMNRYYFMRAGDTAESLSQLFYGANDHSKELTAWNGNVSSMKPGSLVFFVSADQPDDTEMTSFYEEAAVEAETYVVKTGDQVSTIAQTKYGNVMSWKEVAALNRLANPDVIKVGQELALMPTQMKSIHEKPAQVTAQLPSAAGAPVKQAEAQVKVLTEDDADAFDAGVVQRNAINEPVNVAQAVPAPSTQMEKAKDANLAAMEIGQPESSNFTSFAVGAGLFLLALFLFLVRRARSRARAEFMD